MNAPETRGLPSAVISIELSPLRKSILLAVCLLLACAYTYRVLRSYLASHYADKRDVASLERAMRLEPGNALYADRLGRFLSFARQDIEASLNPYLNAVRLNPYEAQYWLDLASTYQFTGNTQEQGRALEAAVRADPHTPAIAWQAGNFFLLQGETVQALREFRVVIENDAQQADTAVSLCWRTTRDVSALMRDALPPEANAYLRLLRLLVNDNRPDDAKDVWSHVAELRQPIDMRTALRYADYSLAQGDIDQAIKVWKDLLQRDQLERYSIADDLIVNGGFEEPVLNGGFDWRYARYAGVTVSIDTTTVHSGMRSLKLDINSNLQVPGVLQLVSVQPETEYEFSGYMKGEGLDGANGPRFAVGDPENKTTYVMSDDMLGSIAWRHFAGKFKTNSNTRIVTVGVVQDPPNTHLSGQVWVDDISLQKR